MFTQVHQIDFSIENKSFFSQLSVQPLSRRIKIIIFNKKIINCQSNYFNIGE